MRFKDEVCEARHDAAWRCYHGEVLSDWRSSHQLASGSGTGCVSKSWTWTKVRQARHFLGCRMYENAKMYASPPVIKAMQKSQRFKPAHLLGPQSRIPVFLRLMAQDTPPEMPSLPSIWAISQGMFAGEGQMQMQRGAWGPGLTPVLQQPLPARAGGDSIWRQANCLVSKSVTLGHYIYSKNFSCPL